MTVRQGPLSHRHYFDVACHAMQLAKRCRPPLTGETFHHLGQRGGLLGNLDAGAVDSLIRSLWEKDEL